MKILTVKDIQDLLRIIGLKVFIQQIIKAMEEDFRRWNEFSLSPRHVTYYEHGVIELMPCSDDQFYTFKFVNGHPGNTHFGKLSIVSIGQLCEVKSGYPLMISEMTLLTAIRTAAVGALAAKYLASENSGSLAIIGTGAQSEFQVTGFASIFPLQEIRFFDTDTQAMAKFTRNMGSQNFKLFPCTSVAEAVHHVDIIITATAAKKRQSLFKLEEISPGTHIHAMGGDCPGKTELDSKLLNQAKVVVEYLPQSMVEGEIQQCADHPVYAELWELICHTKSGRVNRREITLFDSVGFALEDFTMLRVVYDLAKQYNLGTDLPLIPELRDPKNLFGLLKQSVGRISEAPSAA